MIIPFQIIDATRPRTRRQRVGMHKAAVMRVDLHPRTRAIRNHQMLMVMLMVRDAMRGGEFAVFVRVSREAAEDALLLLRGDIRRRDVVRAITIGNE